MSASADASAPAPDLTVSVAGEVATIALAQPDRLNPQTPRTWDALVAARRGLPGTVRVVVLRAEGRAFSAGMDRRMFTPDGVPGVPGLLELAGADERDATARIAGWQRAFDWSSAADVVSIAAVQGHAIGAGFQLALGADIRVAADDASFAMAEPRLGLVPDLGGTKRLVELVGYSRAAELCLTTRAVDAQEALRIGLVSSVVPRDQLDAAVQRTVAALLAVPRDAAIETKALLQRARSRSQADQEAAERHAQYRRLRALAGLDAES